MPDGDAVWHAENMEVLPRLRAGEFQLIYIDPPFNTGKVQARKTLATVPDPAGDRTGFGGHRYKTRLLAESSYRDVFDDYLAFLEPRLREAARLLGTTGTLYFHIDYREAHYCKLLLDEIFGRECFLNEIVWAYDYGARSKRRWPAKHDTILVYVKDPEAYYYDGEAVDREPYMAPGLVTAAKAARGKLPTDVWWHTIVPTSGHEKTGYPTQKPEGIVRRMVQASTRPGDWCLDFFAGSGTLGAVASALDRRYLLIDSNPAAIEVIRARLGGGEPSRVRLPRLRPRRLGPDPIALLGLGPTDRDDLQPLGPRLERAHNLRRDAHDIPVVELDHLIIEQHPPRPADDHVRLLLLAMAVRHRAAQVRRVAEEADAEVARVEMLAAEAALDPGCSLADGVLDVQEVDGGEAGHGASLGWGGRDGGR